VPGAWCLVSPPFMRACSKHLGPPWVNQSSRKCDLASWLPSQVRCWTILAGTLAPQAAGVIHTDFERGFIKAEVVAYDDFRR
jgi:hypothetical protein